MSEKQELNIVSSKAKNFLKKYKIEKIALMINLANLTRTGFKNGDISSVMSPRTVITWAENALIFDDLEYAFKVTFLNKCDEAERPIIAEYYQRCFALELPSQWVNIINNSSNSVNE